MSRFLACLLCLAGLVPAIGTRAATFAFLSQTFTVPEGFTVEQVAGPPLVERPISASFDEEGNLFVTESSGSNDKVDQQLAEKPHRILRLDAADETGRFSRRNVFAEHLMFPEGCLWFDEALYVSAPPSIWRFTDPGRKGVAAEREEWHQGKTLTGCANDLHGPYPGPDGWIYWCKGAFARQVYERPGRKPINTRAAHIFRSPPDHSDIEPVLTAGMDNPVGVVFTAGGEGLMCGTFLVHPEGGKRDGVVHAVYGGVYGKVNDVTDEHKKTGDLMPVMTHLGAAAPCSLIRYESGAFGADYRDNLFVCCFNLHKVTRHVLEPDGATFKTRDSDFIISDNPDFHPTDVVEDADGSLLVIDTGGWYKLCCPTSQLSKPDVLGAIYRIRRQAATPPADPRGLAIAWKALKEEQLAALLGDERPRVRNRAIQALGKLDVPSVAVLAKVLQTGASASARCNAVWALTRIAGPEARAAVRLALEDGTALVRQAAIHSASLWRDPEAVRALCQLLNSGNPSLQRAAAEALGRIGEPAAVAPLLALAAKPTDRVLQHSLIYALIEIGDRDRTAKGLVTSEPREQCAALVALDQMDGGNLAPDTVAPLMGAPELITRQTAAWVAGHHPEWGGALSGYFQERLAVPQRTAGQQEELKGQLAQFSRSAAVRRLLASTLSGPNTFAETRRLILETMAQASPAEPPADWVQSVRNCLDPAQTDEPLLPAAIGAARAFGQVKTNAPDFSEALLRLANQSTLEEPVRLDALAALPPNSFSPSDELLHFVLSGLDPSKPVPVRTSAATALARASLNDQDLLKVADGMETIGPLELTKVLSLFERSTNAAVGTRLVEALRKARGLTSIRSDLLQAVLTRYPDPVRAQGAELLTMLNAAAAKQRSHLEELLPLVKGGDIRRGQAIFNSPGTACSSCHAMGYLGGHVGPDLTSIGQVRTDRDLLEAIVYPSASFVRSYEPYLVKTRSDEEYNGALRKDGADEIILATGPGTEVRIPRSDISDIRPGTVSVMPAGMEQQLTRQELSDLLAFLKATKSGAN
jgi:putative membrane-bound dehydrogenase-like protein